MRTLLALALLTSSASAALMVTPQPAPEWMQVRITPLVNIRALTPSSHPIWKTLYFDRNSDPEAQSFWIQRPTDNIVRMLRANDDPPRPSEHDFAPEFAAGINVLTVIVGPVVDGLRQFTYTAPGGYLRAINTPAPEPGAGGMMAACALGVLSQRLRQR